MPWFDDLIQDLRYGLRLIRKSSVLSISTTLTLALGIGLDTGVFTLIDGMLFRARVDHDPESFVQLTPEYSGAGGASAVLPFISLQDYRAFRDNARSIEDLAAWSIAGVSLATSTSSPSSQLALVVTCNFFSVYGPDRPLLGRTLQSDDCASSLAQPVVVIGEDLWRTYWAADPHIVGRSVALNRHPFTVVGVMPSGYAGQLRGPIWLPYTQAPLVTGGRDLAAEPTARWLIAIGRLRPGYTRPAAAAELGVIGAQQDRLVPDRKTTMRLGNGAFIELPEVRVMVFWIVPVIMGALSLIVLLACGNVTMLLLSRAAARRHEIAVRISLGAARGRLVRMLLTESVMLSTAALPLAIVLARAVPVAVRALIPSMPYYPFHIDKVVLAYLAGVTLLAGIVAGIAPALESLKRNVSVSLQGHDAPISGAGRWRTRDALVAGQVAMSVVLLIGAGVFVRAEQKLMTADLGYESDHVLFAAPRIMVPPYTPQSAAAFASALGDRVRAVPGVRAMAYASAPPFASEELSSAGATLRVSAHGGSRSAASAHNVVSEQFFEALGVRIVRGRLFRQNEAGGTMRPVIVSESLARALWPARDPIGELIDANDGRSGQVVGVAADIRSMITRPGDDRVLYQLRGPQTFGDALLIRFDGDAAPVETAVRAAMMSLNPDTVREPRTLTSIRNEIASRFMRLVAMVLFLAAVAMLLAVIGIYGVVAFAVGRRAKEMGIRAALGATRAELVGLVLVSNMKPVGAGLLFGVAIALLASPALVQLFRNAPVPLDARDPIAYAGVVALLTTAAIAAMAAPAGRAASADPVQALRQD